MEGLLIFSCKQQIGDKQDEIVAYIHITCVQLGEKSFDLIILSIALYQMKEKLSKEVRHFLNFM